jgi:hypothetical protein
MRNPLLSSQPLNTSKTRRNTGEVELGAPTEVFPYRGTESHGVEPTARPRAVPGHEEARDVPLDPPEDEPEPIPVVIRSSPGRQRRYCRTFRDYATVGNARQLVGNDDNRITVKVKNMGLQPIYVGNSAETANAMHGWELVVGETFESATQGTLYASSSDAVEHGVAIHVEYFVDLNITDN